MIREKIKIKYKSKIKDLLRHNELYYDKSNPELSDKEYDERKKEINDLIGTSVGLGRTSFSGPTEWADTKGEQKHDCLMPFLHLRYVYYPNCDQQTILTKIR